MSLRDRVKKVVPPAAWAYLSDLKSGLRHVAFATYDYGRYSRHSGSFKRRQALEHQDAEITKIYHGIEKGLALPSPRPGFGKIVVNRLLDMLFERLRTGENWTQACRNGINALEAYAEHSAAHGVEVTRRIDELLSLAFAHGFVPSGNAVKLVRRDDVMAAVDFDSERFFRTRHSIRNFASAALDRERLVAAIDLARTAPSVCNRQSSRVVIVPNEGDNFELLKYQNGNRGFGTTASAFLTIVSDLRSFVEPEERYQAWIDGGMFSMALVLSLHAKGFGACCLNWSNTSWSDKAFRREARIPDHETVIMLIAVGELPDQLLVAKSDRLPLEDVYRYL